MAIKPEHTGKYSAARTWAERCLVDDLSLFDDEPVWTEAHLGELVTCYVRNPDESKRDFMTKLEDQLASASAGTKCLAAEMFWAMNLFTRSLKPATKIFKVRHVWEWSGLSFPEGSVFLDSAILGGIGSTSPGFQNHFWLEFAYFIQAMLAFKGKDQEERVRLIGNAWDFSAFMDSQDKSGLRMLWHMLNHLLFPDKFEDIASRRHKKAILLALLMPEEKPSVASLDRLSVDRNLLSLRGRLSEQFGDNYNYYSNKEILSRWLPHEDAEEIADDGITSLVTSSGSIPAIPERYAKARFWLIGAGSNARYWKEFEARGAIAIGFEEFGPELAKLDAKAIFDRLSAMRSDGTKPTMDALAAREFSQELKEGDYVLAKQGRATLRGFGRITSGYRFDPDFPGYHHVRSVEWIRTGVWKMDENHLVTTKTLTEFTDYRDWLGYALNHIGEMDNHDHDFAAERQAAYVADSIPPIAYDESDALTDAFIDSLMLHEIMRGWTSKKNLILSGAPGTGKSWLARRLAWLRIGAKDEGRLLALQFHQSYSYDDFVRGWRPGKGQFELVDGPFLRFCEKARTDPARSYVILIDEINRGNLSRIFGELLSLIEADKRRKEYAVRLACPREGEEPFFVPGNVFLLGTMNSADRSLAVVDYALRRRFHFRELEPAYPRDEFVNYLVDKVGVDDEILRRIVDTMGKLNEAIAEDRNLGGGYRIGHSFFSVLEDDDPVDLAWFEGIAKGEIVPLLEEYWFDEPAKVSEWKARLIP